MLYLAGHGPIDGDQVTTGQVGGSLSLEQGVAAAELTGLSLLSTMRAAVGLDAIDEMVSVLGFVYAVPGFTQHPTVIDGCSSCSSRCSERRRHAHALGDRRGLTAVRHPRRGRMCRPAQGEVMATTASTPHIAPPGARRPHGPAGQRHPGAASVPLPGDGGCDHAVRRPRRRDHADPLRAAGPVRHLPLRGDQAGDRRGIHRRWLCTRRRRARGGAGDLGPGATNALTGTVNADTCGTALLTITGEIKEDVFGMAYLQEGVDLSLDVTEVYSAACAYSVMVDNQRTSARCSSRRCAMRARFPGARCT